MLEAGGNGRISDICNAEAERVRRSREMSKKPKKDIDFGGQVRRAKLDEAICLLLCHKKNSLTGNIECPPKSHK